MRNWGIFVFIFMLMAAFSCGNTKPQKEEAQFVIKTAITATYKIKAVR
jgi:hypothetical protein